MLTNQPVPLGLAPSFGFGDRTGLATPGHVAALKRTGGPIRPIFAQQSIREMTRTQRTPTQVMQDALQGAQSAGYTGIQGADADHLKTPADVDRTAEVGFVFFTIDPSDHVDPNADRYTGDQLVQQYNQVASDAGWYPDYVGKQVKLSTGTTIKLDEVACRRAAVKYGRAIGHAIGLAKHIDSVMRAKGKDYEIELSVDETPNPTTLAEHYIIADQCRQANMKLVSLAPRFIGELEKGVDYKGPSTSSGQAIDAFTRSIADHTAIADLVGPYKLSLHSGSDKLSIYAPLAKGTKGRFHVKTAGTSYLEALRVVARHDAKLFRRIIDFSRGRYDTDKATYHVSATLDAVPPASDISDARALEKAYLGLWADQPAGTGLSDPGRQILHCTFGSVLTDPSLKGEVFGVLKSHPDTYVEILDEHFGRHLEALRGNVIPGFP